MTVDVNAVKFKELEDWQPKVQRHIMVYVNYAEQKGHNWRDEGGINAKICTN